MFDFIDSASSSLSGWLHDDPPRTSAIAATPAAPVVCDQPPLQSVEVAPQPAAADKPVDRAAMAKAAAQIFKAADGWGTDEDAIHAALKGKTAAEIAVIKAEYQEHYGKSLDSVLEDELSAEDLESAKAAMSADPVKAAAATLKLAASGMGTDEQAIKDTLRGLSDQQRREVEAEFKANNHGVSLNAMLEDELSGADMEASKALAAGDRTKADAILIDDAMNGGLFGIGSQIDTDEDAINKLLEGRDPADKQKLLDAYEQRTGRTLGADLRANLDAGTEQDLANALLDGKSADAAAIRMQAAAEGLGTDEDAIFKQMEGKTAAQRKAIVEAYNAKYGPSSPAKGMDLDHMLADELGTLDKERADQLVANGELDPVFAMHYAMEGVGTDEDMMKAALAKLTPAQAAKLKADYKQKYGKDLEAEMEDELSGRDEFFLKQSLGGEQGLTMEQKLRRAHTAYDFERGSGAGFFSGFTDVFFDAGTQLDKDNAKLRALDEQYRLAKPEDKPAIEKQLNIALGYQTDSVDAFHAAQDAAATNAATAAAVAATVAVTVASGGLGGTVACPALAAYVGAAGGAVGLSATASAMTAGALAGGLTTMAVKRGISGEAYGAEAAGVDAAMTGVNMVTAGAMGSNAAMHGLPALLASRGVGTFSTAAGGSLSNALATQMILGAGQGLATGAATGLLDEKTWRGPGNGALNFARTAGGGAAGGALGGALQAGGGELGKHFGTGRMQAFNMGLLGGAGAGLGQAAGTPGAFDGPADSIAQRFGVAAGLGAAQGAVFGERKYVHDQRTPALPPSIVDAPPPEHVTQHDQPQRDALIELARQAKTPEEHQTIREWMRELDTENPRAMREALRDLRETPGADPRVLADWQLEADQLPATHQLGGNLSPDERASMTQEQLRDRYNPALRDKNGNVQVGPDGKPLHGATNCGFTATSFMAEKLGLGEFRSGVQLEAEHRARLGIGGPEEVSPTLFTPGSSRDNGPLPLSHRGLDGEGFATWNIRRVAEESGIKLSESPEVLRNANFLANEDALELARGGRDVETFRAKLAQSTPGDFIVWGKDHYMTMEILPDGTISGFDPQSGQRYVGLPAIQARIGDKMRIFRAEAQSPGGTP